MDQTIARRSRTLSLTSFALLSLDWPSEFSTSKAPAKPPVAEDEVAEAEAEIVIEELVAGDTVTTEELDGPPMTNKGV